MKKFEFKKAYEEVEIAGEVYKVDLSDDKVEEYQNSFKTLYEDSQKLSESDIENMTDEEKARLVAKNKENMKLFTDTVLGEGAFERLYELSGRSTVNYMQLVLFISEVFDGKVNEMKETARKKYVKKK